jgi:hypothetical protein
MSLKRRLAAHGFESNDDYDFVLRCLFEQPAEGVRTANLDGSVARRKTAFAQAVGAALDYPRRLYHDCSRPPPPPQPVLVTLGAEDSADGGGGPQEAPLSPFERVLTEACAYSEAESTILVLDQLQHADFHEQIRLYQFVSSREWTVGSATVMANPRNLLLLLVSEQPLYHSLQKLSFRIWTDAGSGIVDYRPEDFGLPADAARFMAALATVFEGLGSAPTPSEYRRIIDDLLARVRSREQLRICLYGRMETVNRDRLLARELDPALEQVVDALIAFLGEESIDIVAPPEW